MCCSEERTMLVNARDVDGEEIQSNAPLLVGIPVPSVSWGVIGIEVKDALMEMMRHVMGKWFNRYMGAAPTSFHRHCDELVR